MCVVVEGNMGGGGGLAVDDGQGTERNSLSIAKRVK